MGMETDIATFGDIVRQVVESLPETFLERLDNVDVVVEEDPTAEQLRANGLGESETLLGLYEGFPLIEREAYGMVVPDKITLFHHPIESICENLDQVIDQIQATVVHEIAHHFGIDDKALSEIGLT